MALGGPPAARVADFQGAAPVGFDNVVVESGSDIGCPCFKGCGSKVRESPEWQHERVSASHDRRLVIKSDLQSKSKSIIFPLSDL